MSMRTRLIIAFLCLSVLPLSAVTAFWYASAVNAFERAAEREAQQTAREIGRRMELVTAAVGRRMGRMFAAAPDPASPDAERIESHLAMLGETAMLVDRLEFHPMDVEAAPSPAGAEPQAPRNRAAPAPPPPPPARSVPSARGTAGVPKVPEVPKTFVVDVRKAMEQARRAAKSGAAEAGVDLGGLLDAAMTASIPAAETGLTAVAESIAREAEKAAEADRARRCASAPRRSGASRSRRARSAAISSTISRSTTGGWRCSSATSPARASAPRCS